jgi:signal transduction histidine kinase/CheY-like chemotaxis protein
VGLFTSSPIKDAGQSVLGQRGYVRDITDRRRLEDQFRQAQKMEGIGTLAGGIAHDFNNLLGIILGFTQLLESGKSDPERFKKSIDTIKKAIERGSGLVRQLLTFARRANPSFHDMNLNEVVTEVAGMLTATFPKTIGIDSRLQEPLPLVTADRAQLSQALINLCVNARDAIELAHRGRTPVGKLTLSTESVQGDAVRRKFTNALLDHYVAISVTDDGAGMDPVTRKRLFEPFFTTKELGKGSGLGLSVVYGVVNSHHGFIDVRSGPSEGTTFTLYFPITEALHPSVVSLVDSTTKIAPGTETILVVEDEEMLRDLLRTYLTGHGYTVLAAQDGEEGFELFRKHHREISLVLSDMGLPRLGGWEMFRKMQEVEPRVKAILASGYFDPNLKLDMVKAGAKDFIQKPYVPDLILQRIREVIDAEG